MVDMVPAHSAMTVCQDSRISGSAAMADNSLCHKVIQSCASLRGSGMSDAIRSRGVAPLNQAPPGMAESGPAESGSPVSDPALSKPASISMRHSSSCGPDHRRGEPVAKRQTGAPRGDGRGFTLSQVRDTR
jgi:hypothetical protein